MILFNRWAQCGRCLSTVVRHRWNAAGGFSGLDRQPQVYIDGNLWGCHWAHNYCGAVPIIVEFIKLLASKGIQTTVILDGAVRHHSKQATTNIYNLIRMLLDQHCQ